MFSGQWSRFKNALTRRNALIRHKPPPSQSSEAYLDPQLSISDLDNDSVSDALSYITIPDPSPSWTACSQVCFKWRVTALGTAALWTRVILTTDAWAWRCIERSKSMPLHIKTEIRDDAEEQTLLTVLEHIKDRIQTLDLQFAVAPPSLLAVIALNHTYPILRSLCVTITGYDSSETLSLYPDAYPMLERLQYRSNVRFVPTNLPEGLTSLEISNGLIGGVGWEMFRESLECLVDLRILTLHEFSVPPDASSRRLFLPYLVKLRLSGPPADCGQFVKALDAPHIQRYRFTLRSVDNVQEMFEGIFGTLTRGPKTMSFYQQYSANSHWYTRCKPLPYPHPELYLPTFLCFSYKDCVTPSAMKPDISFSWVRPLTDAEHAGIFTGLAMANSPALSHVKVLALNEWECSPAGTWAPLLRRVKGVRRLAISGPRTPVGLFWDLLTQLESVGSTPLLPRLEEIGLEEVDCSAGGWVAQDADVSMNSYSDRDGARLLDVLICYLEKRLRPLPRLKIMRSEGYSVSEMKLLRRLVGSVVWDGRDAMQGRYKLEGGGAVNHYLLAGREMSFNE
ncbi:hypothetical protein FB45DRAFT_1060971 [Roridomyces roridus]|uniref:F-box domain-containing protein n=1 Tax=Roridomyces roridus TaxID=1738132 RepID=A0AAD7BM36_9AGAR|nr:hypothetical protein FB45DRAFT_1060971 [Roridomyces roridus]